MEGNGTQVAETITISAMQLHGPQFRSKVTFSLNALRGRKLEKKNSTLWVGNWNKINAQEFMKYTISKGYTIDSYELGNGLSASGVSAKVKARQYGKDMIVISNLVKKLYCQLFENTEILIWCLQFVYIAFGNINFNMIACITVISYSYVVSLHLLYKQVTRFGGNDEMYRWLWSRNWGSIGMGFMLNRDKGTKSGASMKCNGCQGSCNYYSVKLNLANCLEVAV